MAAKKTVKKSSSPPNKNNGLQIVGLILNILVLPGLGTLVGGGSKHKSTGIKQVVIAIISIPLMFVLIGIPIFLAVWVWGIITGIQMVQE